MKTTTLLTSTLFVLALGACSSSPKGDKEPVEAQQLPPNTPTAPHVPEMEEAPATPTETTKVEPKKEPEQEPAQPIEKKEPIVVEQKAPEVKPEPVVVLPVGKCQFVGHRNVAHDFEIKCSAKILHMVYGRMTVGNSLNISANGLDIQIAKHDDHTLEGSVKADRDVMISIVFEDDSRQELEFHGDKVVLK